MAVTSLNSLGSIATHIVENIQVPAGVSGNMVEIVDMARQHVENYTGDSIGSNSIPAQYQPAIVNFSKADTIDLIQSQPGGEKIRLAELTTENSGEVMSSKQYQKLAEMNLRSLGRKVQFARSLS